MEEYDINTENRKKSKLEDFKNIKISESSYEYDSDTDRDSLNSFYRDSMTTGSSSLNKIETESSRNSLYSSSRDSFNRPSLETERESFNSRYSLNRPSSFSRTEVDRDSSTTRPSFSSIISSYEADSSNGNNNNNNLINLSGDLLKIANDQELERFETELTVAEFLVNQHTK